jgi:hypothetical protein
VQWLARDHREDQSVEVTFQLLRLHASRSYI